MWNRRCCITVACTEGKATLATRPCALHLVLLRVSVLMKNAQTCLHSGWQQSLGMRAFYFGISYLQPPWSGWLDSTPGGDKCREDGTWTGAEGRWVGHHGTNVVWEHLLRARHSGGAMGMGRGGPWGQPPRSGSRIRHGPEGSTPGPPGTGTAAPVLQKGTSAMDQRDGLRRKSELSLLRAQSVSGRAPAFLREMQRIRAI